MKNNLVKQLAQAVSLSNATKFHKCTKATKRMIYSKISEFFSLCFKNPIKIKARTFWHGEMLVIFPEVVSLSIYRYGFFEEGLTRMVIEYLNPGMTFIDVGAHFGYFTLLGSYLVGNNGQVHSFEPSPSTYNILKINTSSLQNIILNNCAISSKKETVLINDYGIKYSAYNSIYGARLPKDTIKKITPKKHKIDAISIDEYIENTGIKPDFIKIDAESAEYQILIGMEKTINKIHPIITIEVGDYGVEGVPPSKELIKYLIEKGYKPYEYNAGQIRPHKVKESYKYENILFLSESK